MSGGINQGLNFLAGIEFLHQNGATEENGKTFISRVTAEAFFEATNTCGQALDQASIRSLSCRPNGTDGEIQTFRETYGRDPYPYEDNSSCRTCRSMLSYFLKGQRQLEKDAERLSDGDYVAKDIGKSVLERYQQELTVTDPCRYSCVSCIAENIEQLSLVTMDENCTYNDAFEALFKQSLTAKINDRVADAQQLFAGTGINDPVSLAGEQITDIINTRFKAEVNNNTFAAVKSFQQITIEDGSQEILLANDKQAISVDVIVSVIEKTILKDDMYEQAQFDAQIAAYQKNVTELQGLRGSLKKIISSIGVMWDTVQGRLVIIIAAVLMVIVLGVSTVFFLSSTKQ